MNRYFTVRNDRFATKHVFAGSQRVPTKLVRPWEGPGKGLGNGGTPPGRNESRDRYFHHPDHLGSTNYVTDGQGRLYEHTEYFPFGEPWVEEHSKSTQITPYLFTGKEYDRETGLYYFGARHYDPRTSLWVSVDPIVGDYLDDVASGNDNISQSMNWVLLTYSSDNPLTYIDPNGEAEFYTPDGQFLRSANPEDPNVYVETNVDDSVQQINLNITIPDFHEVASTVFAEASPAGDLQENTGIAHVINNRAERSGISLVESSRRGFFGHDSPVTQDYLDNWRHGGTRRAPAARAGVISVLRNERDPTDGRTMFERTGLLDASSFRERFIETMVAHDPLNVTVTYATAEGNKSTTISIP